MTEQPKLTLVEKIAAACDAVGGVAKQGRNQAQGYDYLRAVDVAKAFRHELFSRGIIIVPDEQELIQREFITAKGNQMIEVRLRMIYRVTDGTSELAYGAFGIAMDAGDKAIGKAKTGALKYFLKGLGILPDEKDDPEADESVDKATAGAEIRKPQALRQQNAANMGITPPTTRVFDAPKAEYEHGADKHLDDMPANDSQRENRAPWAGGEKTEAKGEYISDGQRKRMWAIAKDRGMEKSAVKNIYGRYGAEDDFHIPWKCYKDIMAQIETYTHAVAQ